MTLAVDSSALLAIFKDEALGASWLDLLLDLRGENHLVACDIVWSEIAPLFPSGAVLLRQMHNIGVSFSALTEETCFQAGNLFATDKKRGGRRGRIIADFIVAAHALHQADALATADEDFMGAHFPQLKVVAP